MHAAEKIEWKRIRYNILYKEVESPRKARVSLLRKKVWQEVIPETTTIEEMEKGEDEDERTKDDSGSKRRVNIGTKKSMTIILQHDISKKV